MKRLIGKYNFYKRNGYCILNLFNSNDIKKIKILLSKQLNNISKKRFFNENILQDYHKVVYKKESLHKKFVDPNSRFIKLSKNLNKKILNKELLFILKKEWGHKDCATSWIGQYNKRQVKLNAIGFRIARPNIQRNKKDVAGVHIDLNSGGTIGVDFSTLITIWIPVIGSSSKYSLRISPRSHTIDHSKSFARGKKISYVCNKNYEKKFNFIRPNLNIGQAILFHSNLIHGNSFNIGKLSRMSLDCRILNLKKFNRANN